MRCVCVCVCVFSSSVVCEVFPLISELSPRAGALCVIRLHNKVIITHTHTHTHTESPPLSLAHFLLSPSVMYTLALSPILLS